MEHRDKLDPVSDECALVGYSQTSKAYRLLAPGRNGELTVFDAVNVQIRELETPAFLSTYTDIVNDPAEDFNVLSIRQDDPEWGGASDTESGGEGVDSGEEASAAGYNADEVDEDSHDDHPPPFPGGVDLADADELEDLPHRYPKRDRHPPSEWWRSKHARINVMKGLTDDPVSRADAMARPDAEQWRLAEVRQMSSMREKGVYEVVDAVPAGKKALPTSMRYNIKRNELGEIDEVKCRLVAGGHRQVSGRDYDEIFAPTAQHASFRILLSIAAQEKLDVDQTDVKAAFLNGEIDGEVYVRLPSELGGETWRLKKAMYGLKQAAKVWYDLISYGDSDFAADVDKRRSTTGVVVMMNGCAVMWFSHLQQIVTTSTTEAEFVAAATTVKESLWLRKLMAEFRGNMQPVQLMGDNQATVKLIKQNSAGQRGRSKHIDIQYQFIRDRWQRGDLNVMYVESRNQLADMFTKQLPGPAFAEAVKKVTGHK